MRAGGLPRFVALLVKQFDEVIGPVAVDGVIRLRPIRSANALPIGVTDQQETASYRLIQTGTALRFSYGLGPDSLKAIVNPPRSPVWTMRRQDGSLIVDQALHPTITRAVIGARACDLTALDVLGRTQTDGPHADPAFAAHRQGLFLVAVECTQPAPTCFCGTAGGGPIADGGYDVSLTEIDGPDRVVYLVRAGSDQGRMIVEAMQLPAAPNSLLTLRDRQLAAASHGLIRELPDNAAEVVRLADHQRWNHVAERCLTCGSCTAVCPTCFCTDMDDVVGLDGETATRTRVWDTCFSMEYSHLGEGPHRASPAARYRQWLSHKLGTWHDQYGESGCVGCGRCITWCPVGIDLTAEVEALGRPMEVSS
jgi:sulfhydrogenase subunit beta (sulfur reductase)